MFVEEILARNRAYVLGRAPRPLAPPSQIDLAVITCYDPRLDELLHPALGLEEGKAFLIRTAGAHVEAGGDPLRSLALAVYLFGVRQVAVVGHAGCRMAAFDTAAFIDAFRRRGVPREAFGPADLRAWAGALPDPRRGVLASVAAIRATASLPRDLSVCGLLLDESSGALEMTQAPDQAVPEGAAVLPPPAGPEPEPAVKTGRGAPPPRPAASAAISASAAVRPADASPGLEAARSLVRTLAASAGWGRDFKRLREELARDAGPLTRLQDLERFIQKAAADSKDVAQALDRLRRETRATGRLSDAPALLELLWRSIREAQP